MEYPWETDQWHCGNTPSQTNHYRKYVRNNHLCQLLQSALPSPQNMITVCSYFEGGEVLWCVRDPRGETAGVPLVPRAGGLIATAVPQYYIGTGQQAT